MHPALWELIRLYRKASFRRLLRGARTIRGALVLLLLVAAVGFTLAMTVGMTFYMRTHPELLNEIHRAIPNNPLFSPGSAAPYVPLFLMFVFLQAVLGRGGQGHLYFPPAEVEFLFAGPFHRRELLLFKLSRRVSSVVLGSLLLVWTPLGVIFPGWFPAFVGLSLFMAFITLSGVASTLARLIVNEAAHTRARKAVLFLVGILAAVAMPRTLSHARVLHVTDLVVSFRQTWPGRVLLAPFEVFSHAMFAERVFPDLLGWAAAALVIDLALLALVLKLDADYLEWAGEFSQHIFEIQERFRRGGGMALRRSGGRGRSAIPTLPWLGGAGPIAWRQAVLTGRKCRGLARLLLTISIAVLIGAWLTSGGRFSMSMVGPGVAIGILSYITFLFSGVVPVAFRGDIAHLDVLKALPVTPVAVAVGELGGAVAILAGYQVVCLAGFALVVSWGVWMLAAAAILAPAVDWLVLATANLMLLVYPIPTTPGASADLSVAGRALWSQFLRMLILLPMLGIAAGLAAAVYLASGYSRTAMVAAAFATLAVEAVPLTLLTGWAFDRFDPSLDTPA